MKRDTAIKNLNKVVGRLKACNGIYPTPLHDHKFIKVKRAWVFGSVAKGAENPNDLDIFIEYTSEHWRVGKRKQRKQVRKLKDGSRCLHGNLLLDKDYLRRNGVCAPRRSILDFHKWIRSGMQKVSVHYVGEDEVFDDLDTKYLIYPRNDFLAQVA